MKQNKQEQWEKNFMEVAEAIGLKYRLEIRDFIKTLLSQSRQEAVEDIYRKIPVSLDLHKPMYVDEVLERLKWIFPDIKSLSSKKEQE